MIKITTSSGGKFSKNISKPTVEISSRIFIKLLFSDRYLVGAQVVAGEGVKERIDGLSLAIAKRTTIDELLTMETCYTPAVSLLVDPITFAAKGALRKMRRDP